MAMWIVLLGWIDIAQAVSLLSQFSAAPRDGHLEQVYQIFGYLKQRQHMVIQLDLWPPLIDLGSLHAGGEPHDFMAIYLDAAKDIDSKLPPALGSHCGCGSWT